MASQGPLSPSAQSSTGSWLTAASGALVGTEILSSNDVRAEYNLGPQPFDETVQLVVGGVGSGNNKAATGTAWPAADAYASYGSASDLWGLALTAAQVNATDFGLRLRASVSGGGFPSGYLSGTGFGFSLPAGAMVNGVVAEIEREYRASNWAAVDHVRLTVYYTPVRSLPPWQRPWRRVRRRRLA